MVVFVSDWAAPSACHALAKSIVGRVRFFLGEKAEGFKPLVAKDPEPLGLSGEINA